MPLARFLLGLLLAASLLATAQDSRTPRPADLTQELWRTVDAGDAAKARELLRKGADPNADNGRERILLRALFRKKWEVAEALVEAGASLKIPDRPGCERMNYCESIQAALFASFDPPLLARLKSRGLDLDAVDVTGYTALTKVVVEQPMAIRAVGGAVQAAVAQSPRTGQTVVTQSQPARTVAEIPAPDNAARLKALLDAGVDPNRKYRQLTPLMLVLATHGRPPAMAEALIAAGARIEHDATVPPLKGRDDVRAIPPDIATVTVDADSPTVGGNYQDTLTDMRVGPLGWAVMIGRSDIAQRLLERDRRIESADRNLAYFAADAGSWDLVLAALRYKAEANVANRAGVTPLMLAAHAGRADVVRALIGAGADVRARSSRSWPPLLERKLGDELGAAIAGHSPSKPRLVGGYTAMGAAKERGHERVVSVLRDAGAD